jgi:hypothetical protein
LYVEVVHENEDGFLAVSYAELVPILIEALKEHIKKHETDKTEVKLQLSQLENKLGIYCHFQKINRLSR